MRDQEDFAMTLLSATRNQFENSEFNYFVCGTSYLNVCVQCPILQPNLGEDKPEKTQSVQSCLFAATHGRQRVDRSNKQLAI